MSLLIDGFVFGAMCFAAACPVAVIHLFQWIDRRRSRKIGAIGFLVLFVALQISGFIGAVCPGPHFWNDEAFRQWVEHLKREERFHR